MQGHPGAHRQLLHVREVRAARERKLSGSLFFKKVAKTSPLPLGKFTSLVSLQLGKLAILASAL